MKCELCHEGDAKHQAFKKDGSEVYVCEECFNKIIEEAAQKALTEPLPEPEAPKVDAFEAIAKRDAERDDKDAIAASAASCLASLREKLNKPRSITFHKDLDSGVIDSKIKFLQSDGKIVMDFSIVADTPDGDLRHGDDGTPGAIKSKWEFDCKDTKAIAMKGWCHLGDEHSLQETIFRFHNEKTAPIPALATLTAILGGLQSSLPELRCDFD